MSEPQTNSCNNAGGDFVEVNGLQENSVAPAVCCQNLEETAQPAACQIAQPASGDNQQAEKDDNGNTKEFVESNNNDSNTISQLQEEISKRTFERDDFRKKLEETERKLSALQSSQNGLTSGLNQSDDIDLRGKLEELKNNLAKTKITLEDRDRRVVNQENQISALNKQVSSLKEVVAITKDMLSIRNMEVKHLQEDVDKMESKIIAERERHNAMINKMDVAVRLNSDLKKEYQTQLQLFQDLRGKYEEKVTLLSEENKALETAVQAQPAQ